MFLPPGHLLWASFRYEQQDPLMENGCFAVILVVKFLCLNHFHEWKWLFCRYISIVGGIFFFLDGFK